MAKVPDMSVVQFEALLQEMGGDKGVRLLGIDLGTKTIGLAISDNNWFFASPVYTIRRTKFTADVTELLEYAEKEGVQALVIGLPLNMDDSEGPRAQATRAFVRNMGKFTKMPVFYWDERLSSFDADQSMRSADMKMKKRIEKIDQVAAALILQGCLDRLLEARAQRETNG